MRALALALALALVGIALVPLADAAQTYYAGTASTQSRLPDGSLCRETGAIQVNADWDALGARFTVVGCGAGQTTFPPGSCVRSGGQLSCSFMNKHGTLAESGWATLTAGDAYAFGQLTPLATV